MAGPNRMHPHLPPCGMALTLLAATSHTTEFMFISVKDTDAPPVEVR
jgi:hypothetical protein